MTSEELREALEYIEHEKSRMSTWTKSGREVVSVHDRAISTIRQLASEVPCPECEDGQVFVENGHWKPLLYEDGEPSRDFVADGEYKTCPACNGTGRKYHTLCGTELRGGR